MSHPFDGGSYQARFDALAASGTDVHGEANLVLTFEPLSVLDAGCGTGRVAIELARRGLDVVGVDVNASMLEVATSRAPDLTWVEADLSTLNLGREFDLVVMAGNVPLFCDPDRRADLVRSCSSHLKPGGRLVAGFSLDRGYTLDDYDRACAEAGIELSQRWSTWDRSAFEEPGDYAVSVHRAPFA